MSGGVVYKMNGDSCEEVPSTPKQETGNKESHAEDLNRKDINGFKDWDNSYSYSLSSSKFTPDCDDDWDSSDSQPRGERWPPLGAPNDQEDTISIASEIEYKK